MRFMSDNHAAIFWIQLVMESGKLLIKIRSRDIAMFRFLLESYDNEALFSVLEKNPPLLKLMFAPGNIANIRRILAEIAQTIPLQVEEWPLVSPGIAKM